MCFFLWYKWFSLFLTKFLLAHWHLVLLLTSDLAFLPLKEHKNKDSKCHDNIHVVTSRILICCMAAAFLKAISSRVSADVARGRLWIRNALVAHLLYEYIEVPAFPSFSVSSQVQLSLFCFDFPVFINPKSIRYNRCQCLILWHCRRFNGIRG